MHCGAVHFNNDQELSKKHSVKQMFQNYLVEVFRK